MRNLLWYLKREEFDSCSVMELRQFFGYLTNGHKDPAGRWGRANETEPVKSSTVATYHRHITALFNWITAEGGMDCTPMARIPIPVDRPDIAEPFTDEQVNALLCAARASCQSRRDEALVWFLLDTGARATEVCDLRFKDMDMTARRATVEGKGGKSRPVYFGKTTARALWQYLKEDGRELPEPVFLSNRGEPLTRYGLAQMIGRLGDKAKIGSVRCSPHTFRHTFSISFLRNGGDQFSLMALLGHTDLKMTARYVKLAQADVERQHRQFSPADSLKGKKR